MGVEHKIYLIAMEETDRGMSIVVLCPQCVVVGSDKFVFECLMEISAKGLKIVL